MPPRNFTKVNEHLYRGGAPTISEVKQLHDKYGIERIISLDYNSGIRIAEICRKLGIEHLQYPFDYYHTDKYAQALIRAMGDMSKKTYVHCLHGKDRTGMAVAIYRMLNGWSREAAIKEADTFHYGKGLEDEILAIYNGILDGVRMFEEDPWNVNEEDSNFAKDDAVSQMRDQFSGGAIAPAFPSQQSFSPPLDPQSQPAHNLSYASAKARIEKLAQYSANEEQNQDALVDKLKNFRQQRELKKLLKKLQAIIDGSEEYTADNDSGMSAGDSAEIAKMEPDDVPMSGVTDNYEGVRGVGPAETGGALQL